MDQTNGVMGMAEQIDAANAPPPAKKEAKWQEFTLPKSGRKAKIMPFPKGKHMREAQRVAGDDSSLLGTALAYVLCVVETENGSGIFQRLPIEDIDELAMADAAKLVKEASAPLADEPQTKTPQEKADALLQAAINAQLAVDEANGNSDS